MKKVVTALVVVSLLGAVGTASAAVTLGSASGAWSNPVGGTDVGYSVAAVPYGNGSEAQVRWGEPYPDADLDPQSGLGFVGSAPPAQSFDLGDVFEIGMLTHFNNAVHLGTAVSAVDLTIATSFDDPAGVSGSFTFTLAVDETENEPGPVDDVITFPVSVAPELAYVGEERYQLEIIGFGDDPGNLQSEFVSVEGQINSTKVWGRITAVPIPAPGAVLLVGLGTSFVGFLRRRGTI